MNAPRESVLDFETRSTVKLGKGGTNAYTYARHPTTDVWFARYVMPEDPGTILTWWPHEPMPHDLRTLVEEGGRIVAHNAGFEHAIWNDLLVPRYGWCPLPIEQMDDTAARAARCGLPRSLELAAPAAGLAIAKDTKGATLMKQMARPRKVHPDGSITWWDTVEKIERLHQYGGQDVRVQYRLHQVLPPLPEREREVWLATQRANIRGCRIDIPFVKRAQAVIDKKLADYAMQLQVQTHGRVKSHTDLNGMKAWLASQGYGVESLDKNVVEAMLGDKTLPEHVRQVVSVRAEAGKSSVAKYPAMLMHADADGIARDQLVYYGAISTGRWSGLGIQLQNLPARGGVSYQDAEAIIEHMLAHPDVAENIVLMEMLHPGSAVETLSMCLRGAICARPGKIIVSADYSNIEGRFGAWLGGETWKLDAFRAFDAGHGPDLYLVAAAGILGIEPHQVAKKLRNSIGKVSELSLQYQGGVGAFLSMAANYKVEIGHFYDEIMANVSSGIVAQALENWDRFGKKSGTDQRTWLAAEAVKLAWRARHPGIVQAWYDCEAAMIAALRNPGQAYSACDGKLKFLGRTMFGRPFAIMRLPSGRCVHYANAKLADKKMPWGTVKPTVLFDKVEQGRIIRSSTYGGDIFQTATQGGARDIMANGWLRVEAAGYDGLFSVHDEMVTETVPGHADLSAFEAELCATEDWAAGCPVTAAGYTAPRFRKD